MTAEEAEALDLERANAKVSSLLTVQAAEPFDREAEAVLTKLPASLTAELHPVLRRPATKPGQMNPAGLAAGGRKCCCSLFSTSAWLGRRRA